MERDGFLPPEAHKPFLIHFVEGFNFFPAPTDDDGATRLPDSAPLEALLISMAKE